MSGLHGRVSWVLTKKGIAGHATFGIFSGYLWEVETLYKEEKPPVKLHPALIPSQTSFQPSFQQFFSTKIQRNKPSNTTHRRPHTNKMSSALKIPAQPRKGQTATVTEGAKEGTVLLRPSTNNTLSLPAPNNPLWAEPANLANLKKW
jgi:hypothetical protein